MVKAIASFTTIVHFFLDAVLFDGGIPIAIGVALLAAHRYYPEKFPPKVSAKIIRWNGALLIVGGLLVCIWDTLEKLNGR